MEELTFAKRLKQNHLHEIRLFSWPPNALQARTFQLSQLPLKARVLSQSGGLGPPSLKGKLTDDSRWKLEARSEMQNPFYHFRKNGPVRMRASLLNWWRRTVNLRRPERARHEGSTGPKRLDDTPCKTYKLVCTFVLSLRRPRIIPLERNEGPTQPRDEQHCTNIVPPLKSGKTKWCELETSTEMCSGSKEGSYLRLINVWSFNSRLESNKEEEEE